MLVNLSITEFLNKTAANEPIPGGGSVSALNAALATALTEMVANLTIGKKKYADKEEKMKQIVQKAATVREGFIKDIDADSDAYTAVFEAFKLPKETDEEKAVRSEKIQEATKLAVEVPMQVAEEAVAIMDMIAEVAREGNQNAVTDACVAMMAARTAALGALLNVRINLTSLKDEAYVKRMTEAADKLEAEAVEKEQALYQEIRKSLEV